MQTENQNTHNNPWTDKDVEAHWDRVANIYIRENEKVKYAHDQRFRETIKYLDARAGDKILNITSRDCEADDYVKQHFNNVEVVNAEISQGLIDEAKKVRPQALQLKLEDYAHLPFENGEFDRVISLETLEHVAHPLQFLKELHRVSTAEALLVLSCPPVTSELPYRIYTTLFGGHGEGPHRFLSSKEVKDMLRKSGWHLKLHKGTVLIPVGPAKLQALGEKIINRFQGTFVSELGIRQFYVCEKY